MSLELEWVENIRVLLLHPSIYRLITLASTDAGAVPLGLYFIHINKLAMIRRCNNSIVSYTTRKNKYCTAVKGIAQVYHLPESAYDVYLQKGTKLHMIPQHSSVFHKIEHYCKEVDNILWSNVQWRTFLHKCSAWRTFKFIICHYLHMMYTYNLILLYSSKLHIMVQLSTR